LFVFSRIREKVHIPSTPELPEPDPSVPEPSTPDPPMPEPSTSEPLKGTKWKLAGIVNVETGVLTELEPKDCEKCYTLDFDCNCEMCDMFDFDFDCNTTAQGYSVANKMLFCLSQTCLSKKNIILLMTEVGDSHIGDARLFYDALQTVDSYGIEENELKFFYNNKRNYLLYKLIKQ
jgi:hypothetical protein